MDSWKYWGKFLVWSLYCSFMTNLERCSSGNVFCNYAHSCIHLGILITAVSQSTPDTEPTLTSRELECRYSQGVNISSPRIISACQPWGCLGFCTDFSKYINILSRLYSIWGRVFGADKIPQLQDQIVILLWHGQSFHQTVFEKLLSMGKVCYYVVGVVYGWPQVVKCSGVLIS